MANMRVAKANGESISKQYLEVKTPTPIVVEIKDVIHKELKRLKQIKILGKGYHNNIPLFSSGSNPTIIALKAINKQSAV